MFFSFFSRYSWLEGESVGGLSMAKIAPISDLRNYRAVLDQVESGVPVYLTRNGHSAYCICTMEDEEYFLKAEAMIQLLSELNAGIRSGEAESWLTSDDIRAHLRERRKTSG